MDDKKILEILESEGFDTTLDPQQAIYILRNGALINGDFVSGFRANDHRMIEVVMKNTNRHDPDFWSKVHSELGVVMLVPETKKVLVMENQILTTQQENIVKSLKEYKQCIYCKELKKGVKERKESATAKLQAQAIHKSKPKKDIKR